MPAPRKTTTPAPKPQPPVAAPVEDLNSLLENTPELPPTPVEPEEDPEDREIRLLREELAKPVAQAAPAFVPASELTPKQLEIRELRDRKAKRDTAALENAEDSYDTSVGESILIHFVEDGFTAQGKTWYRGQEVEFVFGSKAYEETKDRFGNTWLDLRDDPEAQWTHYRKEYFRSGPWRGRGWQDSVAAAEERKRNRAAPLLPVV